MPKLKWKFWISILIITLILGALFVVGKINVRDQSPNTNRRFTSGTFKSTQETIRNDNTYLIQATGIDKIRLGSTLDEARKSLPTAKFERSSDGDGLALISVKLGNEELMTLYADEENPDGPIDWAKKISHIEIISPACHLDNGIHPGSLVLDVEKILGKTKVITKSEIESREYIQFINQSPKYLFRLDYTGIFTDDTRQTKKFEPGARIYSILISSRF